MSNSGSDRDPDSDPDIEGPNGLAARVSKANGLTMGVPGSIRKDRGEFLKEGVPVIVGDFQVADSGPGAERGLS